MIERRNKIELPHIFENTRYKPLVRAEIEINQIESGQNHQ